MVETAESKTTFQNQVLNEKAAKIFRLVPFLNSFCHAPLTIVWRRGHSAGGGCAIGVNTLARTHTLTHMLTQPHAYTHPHAHSHTHSLTYPSSWRHPFPIGGKILFSFTATYVPLRHILTNSSAKEKERKKDRDNKREKKENDK